MSETNLDTLAPLADEFNAEGRYYTDKILACGRPKISVVHHRYMEEHVDKATGEMTQAIESRDHKRLAIAMNHENRVFNLMVDYFLMRSEHATVTYLGKERAKVLMKLRKAMSWFFDGKDPYIEVHQ